MQRHRIQFEVECDLKLWVLSEFNKWLSTPRYRLYANNELITERTWIWKNTHFLDEMFWIETNGDTADFQLTEHWIDRKAGNFKLSNVRINEKPAKVTIRNNRFTVKLK